MNHASLEVDGFDDFLMPLEDDSYDVVVQKEEEVPVFLIQRGSMTKECWGESIRNCIRHRIVPFGNKEAVCAFFDTFEGSEYDPIEVLLSYVQARDLKAFDNLMGDVSRAVGVSWNGKYIEK